MTDKDFFSIVNEILSTKEEEAIQLDEGVMPLTPFVAYAAFKKKMFDKFRRLKLFQSIKRLKEIPQEVQAKAKIGVEKTRAAVGATSDDTVYRLTPEQVKIMADVYNKYGKQLVNNILEFRRNVLAPYQAIKRSIKKSSKVTGEDVSGLTHEEFKAALESGRKKIQARGKDYFDRLKELRNQSEYVDEQNETLKKAREQFTAGSGVDYNIVNRLYRTFGTSDEEFEGYSKEELRRVYDEIMKNYRTLIGVSSREDVSPEEFRKARELMKRSRKLWSGQTIDLTKTNKDEFYKKGSFNAALGKYFFSREILNKLTKPNTINIFKKTYLSIIEELLEKNKSARESNLQKLMTLKQANELNDKEKKVWEKRPTIKSFSSDLSDYYQKIRDEDYKGLPETIKRSPKLLKAEERIKNEVKKFERELGRIVTVEDMKKLKKYRLIGRLITIKELHDPENLFKSKAELEAQAPKDETETIEEPEKKESYLTPEEYHRRLKEIATIEYDSMRELNNARQDAEDMAKKMKDEGEEDLVKKYSDLLRQIRTRRNTEAQKLVGHELESGHIIDIQDIEKLAKEVLDTNYTTVDKLKQDYSRLKERIEDYKKKDPDAEKNLEEIGFLMGRIDRKIAKSTEGLK